MGQQGAPQGAPGQAPPPGPQGQADQVLQSNQNAQDVNGKVMSEAGGQSPAQPAQVPAELLTNPEMQQAQMGNVES